MLLPPRTALKAKYDAHAKQVDLACRIESEACRRGTSVGVSRRCRTGWATYRRD
jgi:hypothetical protein